ncbi:MAG TPA: MoxR family ATPase [Longimicrobiales bacterium]|nr:MoxR family ATPase [Longimicrobiales bacterium]
MSETVVNTPDAAAAEETVTAIGEGPADRDDGVLADALAAARGRIVAELRKRVVGQDEVVELMLISLLAGGNSLLVGVPGLAKTLLVQTLASALGLDFARIQFTPDLMPSDITGTDLIQEDPETGRREMVFAPGPLFANVVLADEINRTPPKTQAALLEAMQEHRVTVQGRTYELSEPFFVFATQNPIELEGTYPLPEAQLDRFMFEIVMDHLPEAEELEVVRTTTAVLGDSPNAVVEGEEILAFQALVRRMPVADAVLRHALAITRATRPAEDGLPFVNEWVAHGASVRAAQYLTLGAKARALLDGRSHVSFEDIRSLADPVLRHRVLRNFKAESAGVGTDRVIEQVLEAVPPPGSGLR